MDLSLYQQHFIVTGCSSGFGKAITEILCREGADVTGVARKQDPLARVHHQWPDRFTPIQGDLRKPETLDRLLESTANRPLHGVVLNAGGPPAKTAIETTMEEWDEAYASVFRWKADLALRLLPRFREAGHGRILFVESQSIKQPLPALALSNAMRAAVAGFAKSFSRDVAKEGITVNVLAPGPHDTPAIERVITYNTTRSRLPREQIRKKMEEAVPTGRFGTAEELAGLAAWLLSAHSGFVTGQVLSHDGGSVSSLFG
ncbi:MAG: SDR family oxidoreductase [Cyclonatronaceae bacterium]